MLLRRTIWSLPAAGLLAVAGCEKPTSDYVTTPHRSPGYNLQSQVSYPDTGEAADTDSVDYTMPTEATRPSTTQAMMEQATDGGVHEITRDLPSDQRTPQQQREMLENVNDVSDQRDIRFTKEGELKTRVNARYRQPTDPDDYDSNSRATSDDQLNPEARQAPRINSELYQQPQE